MDPLLFLRVFLPFALGYFISYFFRKARSDPLKGKFYTLTRHLQHEQNWATVDVIIQATPESKY